MKNLIVSILCAVLCIGAAQAQAATKPKKDKKPPEPTEFTGQVSRVVDGDTLWVQTAAEGEPVVVVRIEGIDAPESCQPGGGDATQALTKLALNRNVTVHIVTRDDWGRTVGKVLDGTVDVGDRMVRDGHAWSMRFKYDRGPYVAEERMAIALKRGLHAEGGALLPRDFRQRHGECEGPAPKHGGAVPAAAPVVAAVTAVALTSARRCDGRLHCSQMSSCEEATWFLKNCPGTKMDGDRDGVPCEQQHCSR